MSPKLPPSLKRFVSDRRGNVMIIFGLALLPMLGITALAVDYSQSLSVRAKLDTAADAAAIAGITAAKNYINNFTGSGSVTTQAIAVANAAAVAQFNANAAQYGPAVTVSPSSASPFSGNYVAIQGGLITGSVSYSYTNPTPLGRLLGRPTVTIANTSTSALSYKIYANIYVVIDSSESMGIGATWQDQCTLFGLTGGTCNFSTGAGNDNGSSNSCVLACHTSGTDTLAHNNGVTLRLDVAKQAVIDALNILPTDGSVQVAVYSLSNTLTQVSALSSTFSSVATAVNGIQLGSTSTQGGTNMTYSFNQLYKALNGTTVGNGETASAPLGYVVFVSDGVQDNIIGGSGSIAFDPNFTVVSSPLNHNDSWTNGAGTGSSVSGDNGWTLEEFDPSACTPIKNLGYSIFTLYVDYVVPPYISQNSGSEYYAFQAPLHNPGFPDMFWFNSQDVIPNIPTRMTACAGSSANYSEANTPSEITAAVQNIFKAITTNVAHLTLTTP